MAKKPKLAKKSRFGNPAKAAADAAIRNPMRSASEARLDRAMAALAPGLVQRLEAGGRPDELIDMTLDLLDEFFDLYRQLDPQLDPTSLQADTALRIIDGMAAVDAVEGLAMAGALLDYAEYLQHAGLWTGTAEDCSILHASLQDWARQRRASNEADVDPENFPAELNLAPLLLTETSKEEEILTAARTPMWLNSLALLEWIGAGQAVDYGGWPADSQEAAAVLTHSGMGSLHGAATVTDPVEHSQFRLGIYWNALDALGLVTFGGGMVHVAETATDTPDSMLGTVHQLMGSLMEQAFLAPVDDEFQAWQLELLEWVCQCASDAPPLAAEFADVLANPTEHGEAFVELAVNLSHLAQEGLITAGEYLHMEPIFRPDFARLLDERLAAPLT